MLPVHQTCFRTSKISKSSSLMKESIIGPPTAPNELFSLFIGTADKRAFQTGRALASVIAYYVRSEHYME